MRTIGGADKRNLSVAEEPPESQRRRVTFRDRLRVFGPAAGERILTRTTYRPRASRRRGFRTIARLPAPRVLVTGRATLPSTIRRRGFARTVRRSRLTRTLAFALTKAG